MNRIGQNKNHNTDDKTIILSEYKNAVRKSMPAEEEEEVETALQIVPTKQLNDLKQWSESYRTWLREKIPIKQDTINKEVKC